MHVVGWLGGGICVSAWARLQCEGQGGKPQSLREIACEHSTLLGEDRGTGPASKGFSCVCRAGRRGTGRGSDSWDKVGLALAHCLETGTEPLLSFVARLAAFFFFF